MGWSSRFSVSGPFQSQRDCVLQPSVASSELPCPPSTINHQQSTLNLPTPHGVAALPQAARNPVALRHVKLDAAADFVQNSARMITHKSVRALFSLFAMAVFAGLSAVTAGPAHHGCVCCTQSTPAPHPA